VTGDPQASSTQEKPARRLAPPREANDKLVTGAITIGWTVAFVTMLILAVIPGVLPIRERWWVWTCAIGIAMGLFGLWYVPVLQRRRASILARLAQASDSGKDSLDSGSKTVSSTDTPGRSTRS
jgi:polyferredoxin